MRVLRELYPPIEPYSHGFLDVGGGHSIYWERVGVPGGKPAVFLHGGPGGGCVSDNRRLFDPSIYDVTLFDQRGCGRSVPHGRLEANTTWDLVGDIESLRRLAGVDAWLVLGGSWGATLALAYAQMHPERASELVLRGVSTMTRAELDWCYQCGASQIFPDLWEQFVLPVPVDQRDDMLTAYRDLLANGETPAQIEAAVAWSLWEGGTSRLLPEARSMAIFENAKFALALARIEIHYFSHACWLDNGQLLRDAGRLAAIPGTIVHGRYDMLCPARTAWALHKAWPAASFHLVEGAGHAGSEPRILDRVIEATDHHGRAWQLAFDRG